MPEQNNEISPSKIFSLSTGLLMLSIKREMEEPGYSVIDRITFEHGVIQDRQSYAGEVERVLNELKLTAKLLSEVTDKHEISGKIYEPEEVINYYNGIFLDQVHQLKDKLFQLVNLLLVSGPHKSKYEEPRELKVKKFLKNNEDKLKEIGVFDQLAEWDQEHPGTIAFVLRKRKEYHHFASRLHLNEEFQKIKMSRLMQKESIANNFTDYGKQQLRETGEGAYKIWRQTVIDKQQNTLNIIDSNIEEIAGKLTVAYNIPTSPKEIGEIGNKYTSFLESLEVKNETSINKVDPRVKKAIDGIIKIAQKELGYELVSAYLAGSAGRGEIVAGSSDVNIYIITKSVSREFEALPPFKLIFISEDDFLSDKHKKDRFIIWSDGLHLTGKKFNFKKSEFPKPGTLLCILLNDGYERRLISIRNQVSALTKPTINELRPYSLSAAKIMMDLGFGVAMSNQPYYTANREKKLAYIRQVFPNDFRTMLLEDIYKGGTLKQEDLILFINAYIEKAKSPYGKLLAVGKEVLEKGK